MTMQAELKLVFDSMDELHQFLYKQPAHVEVAAAPVQTATTDTAQPGDADTVAPAAAPVKRTRGPNKPKPALCAQPAAPQVAPEAAAPAPVQAEPAVAADPYMTRAITPEERAEVARVLAEQKAAPAVVDATALRALFGKVNEKHGAQGLAKVSEIVQQFGVQRIAELKPEQFAAAAAACEAALA
jgi:hypothetical protein